MLGLCLVCVSSVSRLCLVCVSSVSRLSRVSSVSRLCLVCASSVPRLCLVCASSVPRLCLVCASSKPDFLWRAQSETPHGPRALDPSRCETNEAVLKRRLKQIQYGKSTCGYQNYLQQVPKYGVGEGPFVNIGMSNRIRAAVKTICWFRKIVFLVLAIISTKGIVYPLLNVLHY